MGDAHKIIKYKRIGARDSRRMTLKMCKYKLFSNQN